MDINVVKIQIYIFVLIVLQFINFCRSNCNLCVYKNLIQGNGDYIEWYYQYVLMFEILNILI